MGRHGQCRGGGQRHRSADPEKQRRLGERQLLHRGGKATTSCGSAKGSERVAPRTMLNIVVVNPMLIAIARTETIATKGLGRQMVIPPVLPRAARAG